MSTLARLTPQRANKWTTAIWAYGLVALTGCGGGGSDTPAVSQPVDPLYTVTASAGVGGTVSPASQQVKSGQVVVLQLTPAEGYKIAVASGCNGTLNGTTYTTGAVVANCAVSVSYELNKYNVGAVTNNGGRISPAEHVVSHGQTASFTVAADLGFKLENIDGCRGTLTNNIYTTGVITADCTVTARFAASAAPKAVIQMPAIINDLSSLTLNGSASSYDPSLSLSYQWSIVTDGSADFKVNNAQQAKASIQLPDLMEDSMLQVTLTVTDSLGRTSVAQEEVNVLNDEHNHNVMLRVVRVTPDWHAFATTDGWTGAVAQRESTHLKYFEVVIWEEVAAVHLYELPNSYDPQYGLVAGLTAQEKINYREQYSVLKITGMPEVSQHVERSKFLLRAFNEISAYVAKRYPDSDHHLLYSGHGGPGGQLFEGQLHYQDAGSFLASYRAALGRKLGVVDMGGPCSQASFSDLDNFCQHTRYYIASDLSNGGYEMDVWAIEKSIETSPEHQYPQLFSRQRNLLESLKERINLKRKAYEYSVNYMTKNKVMQANYLYSCRDFPRFRQGMLALLKSFSDEYKIHYDLKSYLIKNKAPLEVLDLFEKVIAHRADNKDFFEWLEQRNGMMMPNPLLIN